ncbi:MAG: hydrogenase iron-sulfur subunit [Candidatus Bathyarchaeia archaeon]
MEDGLRIICFICDWAFPEWSIETPPNVSVIQVKCIGRLDPIIILETFARGADGVIVVGCKWPDCHFIDGSLYGERTIRLLKKIMALTGLETERLRLEMVSPIENRSLSSIVEKFIDDIKGFGPLFKGKEADKELLFNLQAAEQAVTWSRLRMLSGRERKLTEKVNVYGERISQEEYDRLIEEALEEEYIRSKIYLVTKSKPASVEEISRRIGVDSFLVLQHIVTLRRKGLLGVDRIEGYTPLYKALEVG